MAPFFSGGGYASEALNYIQHLHSVTPNISIEQHGDAFSQAYMQGLSHSRQMMLAQLIRKGYPNPMYSYGLPIVIICHSEPGAWYPPLYQTTDCPPLLYSNDMLGFDFNIFDRDSENLDRARVDSETKQSPIVRIGRTMFETDRIPSGWKSRLQNMDQIWVPTKFAFDIFQKYANLSNEQLWILPEPIDTEFYSEKYVLNHLNRIKANQTSNSEIIDKNSYKYEIIKNILKIDKLLNITSDKMSDEMFENEYYIFLSIFKWEERKGWKFLIQAFIEEFINYNSKNSNNKKPILLILTNAYHSQSKDFMSEILSHFGDSDSRTQTNTTSSSINTSDTILNGLNTQNVIEFIKKSVILFPTHLRSVFMPHLYYISDAFVLPSRGEGWGRPHVEAMSMGRAIIVTNWSGPTEYVRHNENGFLIDIEENLDVIEVGAFRGHFWARPKVSHLKELMRYNYENSKVVKETIGKQARFDMETKYCIECVGKILERKLKQIGKIAVENFNEKNENSDISNELYSSHVEL